MHVLDIIKLKRKEILAISAAHGASNVRVFGSAVRRDDNSESDIDFLVDLEQGRSLLDLGGAQIRLQELLDRKVDLVTEKGLHWYLRKTIIKEAQPL